MSRPISHKAIVEAIEPEWVSVVMEVDGACTGCKARHLCGSGEERERRITIHASDAATYRVGEQVVVGVERQAGLRAIAIAYLLPLLLMMGVLLAMLQNGVEELIAGLSTLGAAGLYYLCVYLFRDKIGREIVFTLSKSQ